MTFCDTGHRQTLRFRITGIVYLHILLDAYSVAVLVSVLVAVGNCKTTMQLPIATY